MKIQNVNNKQKILLDYMWTLNTVEELEKWKSSLFPKDRQEVELLEELIMLAYLDEVFDDTIEYLAMEESYMETSRIINTILGKKHGKEE